MENTGRGVDSTVSTILDRSQFCRRISARKVSRRRAGDREQLKRAENRSIIRTKCGQAWRMNRDKVERAKRNRLEITRITLKRRSGEVEVHTMPRS